jgi:hypothetical protein
MPHSTDNDRVAFIGPGAMYNRLVRELGYPNISIFTSRTIRIRHDTELDVLRGYHPDQVRYVPFDPTPLMWDTIRARGFRPTSIEATARWLNSIQIDGLQQWK